MADVTDLIERFWDTLSRWAVPVMMTMAYAFLALTSETDTSGKLWMAAGLVLVMVVWFIFRALTSAAALSRALSVGDTARLFELTERPLARGGRGRGRFLVARSLAHLVRGEHAEALAALDEAPPPPDLQPLATVLRIVLSIELARPVDPTVRTVRSPHAPWLTWLADGLLAWHAGRLDDAEPVLARVTDDIRAGSALRAIAHVHAARIAAARGDVTAASRHRAAAAELAAPDAAWLRGEPVPRDEAS
jgi:hypothetical protein